MFTIKIIIRFNFKKLSTDKDTIFICRYKNFNLFLDVPL